jgi:hypothetical protein
MIRNLGKDKLPGGRYSTYFGASHETKPKMKERRRMINGNKNILFVNEPTSTEALTVLFMK